MRFVRRTLVLFLLHQGHIGGQRYEYIDNDYLWDKSFDDDDNEWSRFETEDLRFNKFYFPRYALPPTDFKPLIKNDYPISGFVNRTLRTSDAISVITPDDYEIVYNLPRIIDAVGGLPPQPEAHVNAKFWDLLQHVIDVQEIRQTRPFTRLLPLPDLWKDADLNQVAEYVRNEYPGTYQSLLLADILNEKYGEVILDYNCVPYRTDSMFLRKNVMLASMNTWAMSLVGPYIFAAKYYCGRARPEEVVWAIKTGRISDGVPHAIQRKVANLDISNAQEFTAYKEEGCPRHPAWPAMHAASTSMSFWLSVVLEINDEQLCQARLMDYGISYARTVAGVHYEDDNIAGLNMAQEVLARALPKYLKERYNADPKAVARKVFMNRFDWRNFDPNDPCPFLRSK